MTDYGAFVPQIMGLITARWVSQSLYTAVKLGLYESMPKAPASTTAADLAGKHGGLNPEFVYRLLRLLAASTPTLTLHPDRSFSLTPAGETLTDSCPVSLKGMLLLEESVTHRRIWEHLEHIVRHGNASKTGSELANGMTWTRKLQTDAEYNAIFNGAMSSYTASTNMLAVRIPDWQRSKIVADIGGNTGSLLNAVLRAHPHLSGYTLDMKAVVETATVPEDLVGRHRLVVGDFFTGEGFESADTFVMKHVLHDWEDDSCVRILKTIASRSPPHARLLNFDMLMPAPGEPDNGSCGLDIHMMVAATGKEREDLEWRALFERGGWRVVKIVGSDAGPFAMVEAVKLIAATY